MKNPTLTDIQSLSIPERIQVVEDIWDSIARNESDIPLTEAQRIELDHRLERYHQDSQSGTTWVEIKDRLLSHL